MDIHSERERQQREQNFQAKLKNINLLSYQETLDFLEEVKKKLEEVYNLRKLENSSSMPVMIYLIHDHGSQCVHQINNSPDDEEKLAAQKALSKFLKAIAQDIDSAKDQQFPQKTLQLIRQKWDKS